MANLTEEMTVTNVRLEFIQLNVSICTQHRMSPSNSSQSCCRMHPRENVPRTHLEFIPRHCTKGIETEKAQGAALLISLEVNCSKEDALSHCDESTKA